MTTSSLDPVPLLVIGGSAGSLQPLTEILKGLPTDLGAAVLVCQHTSDTGRSQLPAVLSRHTDLPVEWAAEGQRLQPGRIYVAPPGRHLLTHDGRVRLSSGPRVNRHRPSIDVLFASAAQDTGAATTAVVLSGVLDDGAVGAALVDLVGGRVLAENPDAAAFASMPRAALAAAPRASIMTSRPISHAVVEAVINDRAARSSDVPPGEFEPEVDMQGEISDDPGFLQSGENRLTRLACPDCGGGLAQVDLPQISYFRCHVGHQYGPQSLAAAQATAAEHKLWSAVAALEEQAVVLGYLEDLGVGPGGEPTTSGTFRSSADELTSRASALRDQVQRWTAARAVQEGPPGQP